MWIERTGARHAPAVSGGPASKASETFPGKAIVPRDEMGVKDKPRMQVAPKDAPLALVKETDRQDRGLRLEATQPLDRVNPALRTWRRWRSRCCIPIRIATLHPVQSLASAVWKETAPALGLALVAFFREAGVDLVAGDDGNSYVRRETGEMRGQN